MKKSNNIRQKILLIEFLNHKINKYKKNLSKIYFHKVFKKMNKFKIIKFRFQRFNQNKKITMIVLAKLRKILINNKFKIKKVLHKKKYKKHLKKRMNLINKFIRAIKFH